MSTDVVDYQNIGMIKRAGGLCFLFETSESVFVGGKRRRQNFDGDIAPQFRIPRTPNFTHTPFTDLQKDGVWTKCCVWGQRFVQYIFCRQVAAQLLHGFDAEDWADILLISLGDYQKLQDEG